MAKFPGAAPQWVAFYTENTYNNIGITPLERRLELDVSFVFSVVAIAISVLLILPWWQRRREQARRREVHRDFLQTLRQVLDSRGFSIQPHLYYDWYVCDINLRGRNEGRVATAEIKWGRKHAAQVIFRRFDPKPFCDYEISLAAWQELSPQRAAATVADAMGLGVRK